MEEKAQILIYKEMKMNDISNIAGLTPSHNYLSDTPTPGKIFQSDTD